MNQKVKALLMIGTVIFFYMVVSMLETIENEANESIAKVTNRTYQDTYNTQASYKNNAYDGINGNGNGNGSNNSNSYEIDQISLNSTNATTNETLEMQLAIQKNAEMFEHLRWILILGNWNSQTSNQASQFGDFEQNTGKIKLRFHYEISSYRDYPRQALDIYIYDGQYNDGKVQVLKLRNGTFDFLERKYISIQNNTNISQFIMLEENSNNRMRCNTTISIDFTELLNNTNLHTNIEWNNSGNIKLLMQSSDCSINLQADLKLDTEKHENKAIYYSMLITVLSVLMLYSVAKMIRGAIESNNDANKLSMITFGWLTTWDAFICLSHLYLALSIETMFHFFIMPTFWYFILFSIFELKLLQLIWRARYYDQYQNQDQIRKALMIFYTKLYAGIFIGIFLLYKFVLYETFLIMMSFYFVPQIIHNAMRGQRADFNGKWISFMCASKILLPLYFRGCPYNLLEISPSPIFCVALVFVISAQVTVLYYQSLLGSRFFVPKKLLPPKFEYLMKLPDHDIEASYYEQLDDCVVCLRSLYHEVALGTDDDMQTRYLYQRLRPEKNQVMRTPCNHKFHVKCLVNWMSYKMECPTCRSKLPCIE